MRVRFWMDSSITSDRTTIIARDCSSVKPSCWRRWTNFRVSKWWSLRLGVVAEKARRAAWWIGVEGVVRRWAQVLRAKAAVAVVRLDSEQGGV